MINKYSVLTVLFLSSVLHSQILEDKRQHTLLLQGIHYTVLQKYDSAETTFQQIITEYPKHPTGYLYLAGMLQAKFTDYSDYFNEKQYDSLLNIVEMLSEPFIKDKKTEAQGYFYLGSAEAFRSYTRSENGNIPSGIYYGLSAGRTLQKCLEADSNFIEAKNILGSFYYWRSKLAWIPFVPDRSEDGIKLIVESFSHPYEKHLASHNLMVIFTEEKEYEQAEKYGLIMLEEYPDNRLFLWNLMSIYEKWNKKKELYPIVERLLKSATNAKVINYYTVAVCKIKLAQFAISENRTVEAKKHLSAVIDLKKHIDKTKSNLKKQISKAQELIETISE